MLKHRLKQLYQRPEYVFLPFLHITYSEVNRRGSLRNGSTCSYIQLQFNPSRIHLYQYVTLLTKL